MRCQFVARVQIHTNRLALLLILFYQEDSACTDTRGILQTVLLSVILDLDWIEDSVCARVAYERGQNCYFGGSGEDTHLSSGFSDQETRTDVWRFGNFGRSAEESRCCC